MPNKKKLDETYMNVAYQIAGLSKCKRRIVGAIIVKDNNILSFGYNGTPAGMDNCCENEIDNKLYTKWLVLHAETNAITKVARSTMSSAGSTLYTTTSPCAQCAKLIIQAGIKRVVFHEKYHASSEAFELFKESGIKVKQLKYDQ